MSQLGFYVDTTRCTDCNCCEIACRDANGLDHGPAYRRLVEFESGAFPHAVFYALSLACNHCDDPACARVCPVGAYTKREEDGIVLHDPGRCVGCRYCVVACPYGAPKYFPQTGMADKCDLCHKRLNQGQGPICVEACPNKALDWGPIEELIVRYPGASIPAYFPDSAKRRPNLLVKLPSALGEAN